MERRGSGKKGAQQRRVCRAGEKKPVGRLESAEIGIGDKVLDGSYLEGGGQIIRNAAALSALSGQAVSIEKVRNNRRPPGLQPQHCTGFELVACICDGSVGGAEVQSQAIRLLPQKLHPGHYVADSGTAGACTLLTQAALPCLLLAGNAQENSDQTSGQGSGAASSLELTGGTDVKQSPSVDYIRYVLSPTLQRLLNVDLEVQLHRRGFYPKGNGSITVQVIKPIAVGKALPAFQLTERGEVTQVWGQAYVAGVLPLRAAKDMLSAAESVLKSYFAEAGISPELKLEAVQETSETAFGNGVGLLLVATTDKGCLLGATSVVDRGQSSAAVGKATAEELVEDLNSGACVDRHLQDQLVVFMAVADGTSSVRISEPTLHTRTALWVAETIVGCKTSLEPLSTKASERGPEGDAPKDSSWMMLCRGVGLKAGQ